MASVPDIVPTAGFAFVYMEDDRDAEDAIRKLHDREFGYKRRPLKVQWAKQAEADRKKAVEPSATIFVVNFDVQRVTERDLLAHFDYYGPIRRIEIRKNYAFIQYDSIKDAVRALESENGRQLKGRTITVEYVEKERGWGDRGAGGSRSRSPRRRSRSPVYDRRRSPSPRRRSLSPRRDSRSRSPRR